MRCDDGTGKGNAELFTWTLGGDHLFQVQAPLGLEHQGNGPPQSRQKGQACPHLDLSPGRPTWDPEQQDCETTHSCLRPLSL